MQYTALIVHYFRFTRVEFCSFKCFIQYKNKLKGIP